MPGGQAHGPETPWRARVIPKGWVTCGFATSASAEHLVSAVHWYVKVSSHHACPKDPMFQRESERQVRDRQSPHTAKKPRWGRVRGAGQGGEAVTCTMAAEGEGDGS